MSLQIWLPLNGNISNQGLSGNQLTGSPNSWGKNGKLGQCATFNGNTANVIYNNTTDFNYIDNFSYCMWLNQNYTGSTAQYAFTVGRVDAGGRGYGVQILSTSSIRCWFGNKTDDINCSANEWHHIAVTLSGKIMKIYVDGKLSKTNSTDFTLPTYSDGNGLGIGCFHYTNNIYPYYGSINDFRIYNHCLSAKEVSEIAKGLICHYKLSRNGNPNLIPKSAIINNGCSSFSFDENNILNCIMPVGSTNWGHGIRFIDIDLKIPLFKGQTMCFSLEIKPNVACSFNADVNNATQDNSTTSNDNDDISARKFVGFSLKANVWNKVYWTYTAKNYDLYEANSTCGIVTTNLTSSITAQIRNIKVEYGNLSSLWCPNSEDTLYTTLGYNDKTEYDCSGYGHHGTVSGDIKYSNDSPRYSGSYIFSSKTFIKLNKPMTINNASKFTVSLWVKLNSGCGGYSTIVSNLNSPSSGFWMAVNTEGSGTWFFNGNYAKGNSLLTINTWYFISMVFNAGTITWYINGSKSISTNVSSRATTFSDYIALGNSYTGTSWNTDFNGSLSDFRIYSTALSDADIKALYDTPISLSKNGTLFANEFVEEGL